MCFPSGSKTSTFPFISLTLVILQVAQSSRSCSKINLLWWELLVLKNKSICNLLLSEEGHKNWNNFCGCQFSRGRNALELSEWGVSPQTRPHPDSKSYSCQMYARLRKAYLRRQKWSLCIYLNLPFIYSSLWFVPVSTTTMSSPILSLSSVSDYSVFLVFASWLLSAWLVSQSWLYIFLLLSPLFSVQTCLLLFQRQDFLSKANLSIFTFDYLSPLELLLHHLSSLYLVTSVCYWIVYSFSCKSDPEPGRPLSHFSQ